ncbi:RsmB/NOP family class I SAM-dependent RNA methyltransferase [Aurantimonas sp. Leaf443]|uniref:RsmB/NOP family class I SAM-dependent RNA methyltransferase n=1 Tax=Aurantimonas sp. Leaf443 TaxID=1736378 RepID=UPI0006F73F06|nr:RsmB/NOP family class I SAM-dependent RNA methyltransferase [Aurantimonas sp. Leaf443]KQT83808.1 MFS transporter [Aurantimonas sp. Leaf443]
MRLGGRIAAAVEVLDDMAARRRPVADALKDWGLSHRFAGSGDRSAIGNLVYDVLRRRRSLAHRMGMPDHAALVYGAALEAGGLSAEALGEALEGDRFAPPPPPREVIDRFLAGHLDAAPGPVRADVPDWLEAPLAEALGADWVAETAALCDRPPLDLRVNTLKASRADVEAMLTPFAAAPTPLSPLGLRIAPIEGAGRHPNVQVEAGFQTGLFEIQDEGSQIAALLSGAAPGERVLDLCAGAGGKTLALSALMENSGALHATDADRQRLAPIYERLARAGASNVIVHAPREDIAALEGTMDLVLVDAPCTGTGTWRRRPDAKWRLSQGQLAKRMEEQDKVLATAARFVRPGGRLAYITCSVLRAENAARVEAFLAARPDFGPADAAALFATVFPAGREAIFVEPVATGSVLTMTPRRTGTDGFFFALLTRTGS